MGLPNVLAVPAAVLLLWTAVSWAAPSPAPASPKPGAPASPSASTKDPGLVTGKGGQFSIQFPSAPEHAAKGEGDDDPNVWILKQAGVELTFGYKQMSSGALGDPNKLLDHLRDRFLQDMKATSLGDKYITVSGCVGRQLKYRIDSTTKGIVRYYLVMNRLYTLSAAIDFKTPTPPTIKPFLTSLKVKPFWYRVDVAGGRTTIWMPSKPQSTSEEKWIQGRRVVAHLDMCPGEGGQVAYFAGRWEFPETPDTTDEKMFDNVRDAMLASTSTALVSQNAQPYKQYPGRAFESQAADGSRLRMRLYSVDNTLYLIYLVMSSEHTASKLDDEFMDGFQVDDNK
jgi:hypothetical protein